jgi:hypothetical protein
MSRAVPAEEVAHRLVGLLVAAPDGGRILSAVFGRRPLVNNLVALFQRDGQRPTSS